MYGTLSTRHDDRCGGGRDDAGHDVRSFYGIALFLLFQRHGADLVHERLHILILLGIILSNTALILSLLDRHRIYLRHERSELRILLLCHDDDEDGMREMSEERRIPGYVCV